MNKPVIIVGVVFLVLGIAAGAFMTSQTQLLGMMTTSSAPYREYMAPLLVGGVVLILVGALNGKNQK